MVQVTDDLTNAILQMMQHDAQQLAQGQQRANQGTGYPYRPGVAGAAPEVVGQRGDRLDAPGAPKADRLDAPQGPIEDLRAPGTGYRHAGGPLYPGAEATPAAADERPWDADTPPAQPGPQPIAPSIPTQGAGKLDLNQMLQQMLQNSPYQQKSPEEQKRDKIRAALAAAGKAMSSGGGNILQSISSGLGSAATAYHGAGADATTANQKAFANQFDLINSLLTGQRQDQRLQNTQDYRQATEERANIRLNRQAEETAYEREQDKAKAAVGEEKREYARKRNQQKDLRTTEEQTREARTDIEKMLERRYADWRKNAIDPTPEEASQFQAKQEAFRKQMEERLGIRSKTKSTPDYKVGDSATGPNGEKAVLTDQGWMLQTPEGLVPMSR